MDPLTLFSYVPLIGIFVFLVALAVVVAILVKRKQQTQETIVPVPSGHGLLSDKRIFPLLIVVIVLVVGLGTSVVLVRNQQENRTKAYVPCDPGDCPNGCNRDGSCKEPPSSPPDNNPPPNNPPSDNNPPPNNPPPDNNPPQQNPYCSSSNNKDCIYGCNPTPDGGTCKNAPPPPPPSTDPAGCCGSNADCGQYGSGQVCNVPNGACSTGKSCNDSVSGKFHQGCISGVCVQIPGDGANDCSACNWTPPSAVTDQGNHITHACLSDVSCSSSGCTAKNNCSYAVTVCGGTYNCEGNTSGYCGPAWSGVAQNGCIAIQPGTTGKVGTVEKTGCGSWQADITVQGYTGDKGLASANGYDSSECKTTTTNGGPPPSGPNPTPTPTPPITVTDAACSQIVADKTLSTLAIGDTVTFTGYGWVDKTADSIDLINFIISKDGVEVSNTNVTAVRASEKDVAGYYYYKASSAYTISSPGSYSVKIRVHWVGGNVWRE